MGQSQSLTVYRRSLRGPAALLTLGAAAIHLSAAPDHLQEYVAFGGLFIVVGIAQAFLGLAAWLRPSRRIFVAAVLIALGCLVVWTISRTAGLPIGPTPGKPEPAAFPDLVTSLFEVTSVPLLLVLIVRGPRQAPDRRRGWLGAMVPLAVVLTLLTFLGVMTGLNPLPFAVDMSTAPPGPGVTPLQMLTEPPGDEPVKAFTLTARVTQQAGHQVWTYNGTVPGPELRVTQGDRVRVTLINHLPAATSIHWHGLRLPNAEDGVAGLTQQALAPGQTYTYEFVVKDPGTYWYHSHQDTEHQVPKGLYGALVVLPGQGPTYDRDYAVAVGDLNGSDAGDRIGANGLLGDLHLTAHPGELVRLRLIDAIQGDMTGFPELLTLLGAPYRVIALDGHDLNGPTDLGPELLPIGIGQRYDLAFRMPSGSQVKLIDNRPRRGSQLARTWTVTLGEGPTPPPVTVHTRFDLATYGTTAPDEVAQRQTFDESRDLVVTNQHGFRYGSEQFLHMFNGRTFPDTQPIIVRKGLFVRLRFVNNTDEYHPIHLHGHVYSVIRKNGRPISGTPVHLDSILVGPHETWEGAFLADNPGLWMLHCHVLVHAAFGLSTMVSYEGVSTPYSIGSRSGNFPE
ncbi:MAG TPA: multicopper oxidase family protein [Candidatus Dormibacteraeota bacterium]|nr:multicopper oxidase family protein [Candidatus Dormibacteraeota bacterium]